MRFNSFFEQTKLRVVKIKDIICRKHSKDLERKHNFIDEPQQLDHPEFDMSVSQDLCSSINSDDTVFSTSSNGFDSNNF